MGSSTSGTADGTVRGDPCFISYGVMASDPYRRRKGVNPVALHSVVFSAQTAQKFFWQNIVCRFGVPSKLTVNNGKQFDSQDFKDFCFSIGTKLAFASVYHPQSNGVVERANGKIFTAVKKMLLDEKRASGPICYLRRSGR